MLSRAPDELGSPVKSVYFPVADLCLASDLHDLGNSPSTVVASGVEICV